MSHSKLDAQENVSAALEQSSDSVNIFPCCATVEITVAAHDTTGGMVTKITEAAMIARLGIDVYIVKVTALLLSPFFLSFDVLSEELVVLR